MTIPTEIKERYQFWLTSPVFDETTKNELSHLSEEEISDRFYCDLEFGTSGMRGILGAGTNRMNVYLVRRLSWSLGKTILESNEDTPSRAHSVVISYDSRRCSTEFAQETALVLTALGIKAYLFQSLRPTPELSFAVRHLGADAGVMITASHNPKEYNGYKVYGQDGAQIPPHYADKITEILKACPWDVPVSPKDNALASGLLEIIGPEVDKAYLDCVRAEMLCPQMIRDHGQDLSIIYTPLHGAGKTSVRSLFDDMGFTNVFTVPEQAAPDTEFSTVLSPNPEDSDAWELALKYADHADHAADILIATDPDADRLGVQCRLSDGSYHHFTGNQIGLLLTNYILESLSSNGRLPADGVLVHNIVSTALTRKLTDHYGAQLRIVPVGFKFIGEQIKEMEASGSGTFLFGFEESIGYLKGTYTRDKDAVLAAALVSEAALYYKHHHGKTLYNVLTDIFQKFGCFLDEQMSLKFEGKAGKEKISHILQLLESSCRSSICGQNVTSCSLTDKLFTIQLENGGFIKARPSGTEPKIRFYFCIGGRSMEDAATNLEEIKKAILQTVSV